MGPQNGDHPFTVTLSLGLTRADRDVFPGRQRVFLRMSAREPCRTGLEAGFLTQPLSLGFAQGLHGGGSLLLS